MRGARCEEGCTQWAAACGPGGWAKPAPWAAGGPRVHTYKQLPNPILALLSGRFEARVYASEKGSRIQLKRLPDHGLAPCNMGCVVCDLMARERGIPPARKGAMDHPITKGKPESLVRGVRGRWNRDATQAG
jgi:hypothetical protein